METNSKYKKIYKDAFNKTSPEWDGCTFECDSEGNEKPATPIGYDDEQLQFDALSGVIQEAFTKSKDYVCWSNGGYIKKTKDPLETLEGPMLKEYDPVLILGNFGEPMGFMMFSGKTEFDDNGYFRPDFLYLDNDDNIRHYRPKVYISK